MRDGEAMRDPESERLFFLNVRQAADIVEQVIDRQLTSLGEGRHDQELYAMTPAQLREIADRWESQAQEEQLARDIHAFASQSAAKYLTNVRERDLTEIAKAVAARLHRRGYRYVPEKLDIVSVRTNGLIDIDDPDQGERSCHSPTP